ncbi:unnamed protein product [Cochlearia groenlandica]
MRTDLKLPIIDLSSSDKISTSRLIRQPPIRPWLYEFFLVVHGVSQVLMENVFKESKNLFSLPLDHKMVMMYSHRLRGYSPLYNEKLDSSSTSKGDSKEMFVFGSSQGCMDQLYPYKWPSQDLLPLWRETMDCYYKSVTDVGRKVFGLVAMALNLDENFFERAGGFSDQAAVVRLLRYSGELDSTKEETCAASAHSDFGMITLLATDGVPGLQVCRDKEKEPNVWEDVPGIKG